MGLKYMTSPQPPPAPSPPHLKRRGDLALPRSAECHALWFDSGDGQHAVAEARHHEELLQHGVHVADAAQVGEAHVARGGFAALGDVELEAGDLYRKQSCRHSYRSLPVHMEKVAATWRTIFKAAQLSIKQA